MVELIDTWTTPPPPYFGMTRECYFQLRDVTRGHACLPSQRWMCRECADFVANAAHKRIWDHYLFECDCR